MPAKILVVDDEEDFRSLLETVLKRAGYSVVTAESGESGLAAHKKESPDLIVLDVQMPDMGGFEVCRRIRADGPRKDIPILFCTVRSAVAPVAEGLNVGANDYVLKPFDTEDLLSRVEAALPPGARK
ncbi:MAG: response regulator [Elusimicrobiota bacterium]